MNDVSRTEPVVEDRRAAAGERPVAEERRKADRDRRIAPRLRVFKGARMIVAGGQPIVCLVRNISETGARIQISEPILHNSFVLVFDDAAWPPRTCRVVWRRTNGLGVTFETAAA